MTPLPLIAHMPTLRSLELRDCDAAFQPEGARSLSRLSALTELVLKPTSDPVEEPKAVDIEQAVEILLQSLVVLEDLTLEVPFLTDALAHSLARHSSLSSLDLSVFREADSSAAATLISESKSISSLTLFPSNITVPRECVQRNVHLLDTNAFRSCPDLVAGSDECKQLEQAHEARLRARAKSKYRCRRTYHSSGTNKSVTSVSKDMIESRIGLCTLARYEATGEQHTDTLPIVQQVD
jgi:hypothetical protein